MFHPSNVELPFDVERWLCKMTATPRMRGIHHTIVPEELNSNWSSGLTVWDWLHGTLRLNVPQNHLTLGVAAFPDTKELTHPKLMEIPFEEQQRYPPWVRPDGTTPRREGIRRRPSTVLVPEANKNLFPSSPATRVSPAAFTWPWG